MTKKLFYFIAFLLVSISLSFIFRQRATAESYTSFQQSAWDLGRFGWQSR